MLYVLILKNEYTTEKFYFSDEARAKKIAEDYTQQGYEVTIHVSSL